MEIYSIGFAKKTAEQFFSKLKSAGIRNAVESRYDQGPPRGGGSSARPRELLNKFGQAVGYGRRDSLVADFDAGQMMKAMARAHGRTRGAIRARLIKLGKID